MEIIGILWARRRMGFNSDTDTAHEWGMVLKEIKSKKGWWLEAFRRLPMSARAHASAEIPNPGHFSFLQRVIVFVSLARRDCHWLFCLNASTQLQFNRLPHPTTANSPFPCDYRNPTMM
ncbi:hypothetical protein M9H77_03474 [Catharanthus roseus]|uniref:Uncharacterized protein n=1 Tax=Catharanthus roseus TaxID=4058 RepID=A0ACC0CBE6_CATRO|nr:hypothetical protein M9H77_03474 [Catharanthus roseus]